jgi:hypothetical protein
MKREQVAEHLIEYQLNMIGKTIEEVKNDPQWYYNNHYTQAEYLQFRSYAVKLIKKVFKCNKLKAEKTFDWFNLAFGLRVIPTPEERKIILEELKKEMNHGKDNSNS